jgi:hypothetical protein
MNDRLSKLEKQVKAFNIDELRETIGVIRTDCDYKADRSWVT